MFQQIYVAAVCVHVHTVCVCVVPVHLTVLCDGDVSHVASSLINVFHKVWCFYFSHPDASAPAPQRMNPFPDCFFSSLLVFMILVVCLYLTGTSHHVHVICLFDLGSDAKTTSSIYLQFIVHLLTSFWEHQVTADQLQNIHAKEQSRKHTRGRHLVEHGWGWLEWVEYAGAGS